MELSNVVTLMVFVFGAVIVSNSLWISLLKRELREYKESQAALWRHHDCESEEEE